MDVLFTMINSNLFVYNFIIMSESFVIILQFIRVAFMHVEISSH